MSCPVSGSTGTCPVSGASNKEEPSSLPKPQLQGDGEPIPHPPTSWFTGNLKDVDPNFLMKSVWGLADIYGPIFSLDLISRKVIVLSSHELIDEACDDVRFEKSIKGGQERLRPFVKNGLFTAYSGEHEWHIAHRTLMPAFGPVPIRKMFPQMMDIASQMVLRWDRLGPDNEILCSDDFTISLPERTNNIRGLAFDTIGICAFNYRFNEFYMDSPHPFAQQMVEVLQEGGRRAQRLELETTLRVFANKKFNENIALMHKLCDDIVAERKAYPRPEVNDLLNVMLHTQDPVTGEKLSDENIRYQMATFLVAGHETTSGTLCFLFYNLLQNPDTLHKCYNEVDEVIGDSALEIGHLSKLKYIEACIRETLRYRGPIPALGRQAKEPTTLGGKYKVEPSDMILLNLVGLHHDPKVYGNDADQFKPERFLDGGWERLPRNSWKPFGSGERACIGRALAEQEMMIAVALILQRFTVERANPHYVLHYKAALTIKPDEFCIKVRRRPGKADMVGIPGAPPSHGVKPYTATPNTQFRDPKTEVKDKLKPITIFYGGNTGTCKSYAEDIQSDAPNYGFTAEVKDLDSATQALPTDRPTLIITASYEGMPPDNSKNFVAWLEQNADKADLFKGVKYSVLGVGNSEWYSTFHRIPKLVNDYLAKMGATQIHSPGFINVREDIVGPFEDWKNGVLLQLRSDAGAKGVVPVNEVKISIKSPEISKTLGGEGISEGEVIENKPISEKGIGPEKRHLEIKLPQGSSYRTGDYLVVLPFNQTEIVLRAVKRFGLHVDDIITVSGTKKQHLLGDPISIFDLLAARVELSTPASQRQVETLASFTVGAEKEKLSKLASEGTYQTSVLQKRFSILDLLDDFPSCELPFETYLNMLLPLSPRQYSISSYQGIESAIPQKAQAPTATITYDVIEGPALSGSERVFKGTSSTHLAKLTKGSRIRCFLSSTNTNFHLPPDPETPIIMISAGTGIAPMRGFIQERAAIAAAGGRKLGPAILYFGCRDHSKDFLYHDELLQWEKNGVVQVRPAFSVAAPPGIATNRVPDRIWEEREELSLLFREGAKIFVCGSAAKLGRSTTEVIKKIVKERLGMTDDEADEWVRKQREERYVSDVFD